ncbi:MAG: hypothetical protein K2X27_25720 [Candidatus Obscuribacterales bacterium]|nr:hypothetical protein [Candidatus Obscuribacterales bacterium]
MAVLSFLSDVFFWLCLTYLILSLIEFVSHGVLMHQPTWLSRHFKYFQDTLDEHRSFHHAECFPGRKMDQGEGDCLKINIKLRPGLSIFGSCWIWGPLLYFSPLGACIFVLGFLAHNLAWNLVHVQMHTKLPKRARWFQRSRLCLFLARYHYMHHIYPRKNHNVVCPLIDWVMRTYQSPSEKDLEAMKALGFLPETRKIDA